MKYAGYYNGEIGNLEEMKIPMLDRAVFFGDGCYDASTFRGGKIFAVQEHFDRFYRSCEKLHIPFPLSKGTWQMYQGVRQRQRYHLLAVFPRDGAAVAQLFKAPSDA